MPAPFFVRSVEDAMTYHRFARPHGQALDRATGRLGWARGAIGAGLGLAASAVVTHGLLGSSNPMLPWIFGPIGASAVLVFLFPASPLAQPWPVIGGTLLPALVGLLVGQFAYPPAFALALAAGAAIGVMSLARCLHPPGGACALLGALSAAPFAQSCATLLLPLAVNLAVLLTVGWLYNRSTGHSWPHRQIVPPSPPRTLYRSEDLDAVLDGWDEALDVSREDLDAVFRAVERRVLARGDLTAR